MNVADPLYGRFILPEPLATLAQSSEVRRLSEVRLLNAATPSLATLGELRRYSHTLGVLRLAMESNLGPLSKEEREAFLAAVLLHDTGTPPFAHLLEYQLRELSHGWNHEDKIVSLLRRQHVRENRAHQIFRGRPPEFLNLLERHGVRRDFVEAISGGSHYSSSLLFGSLDLDNLDNVVRMGWALGLGDEGRTALTLARNLTVDLSGLVRLPVALTGDVERWAALRRACYEVIVFDQPTVAAQAVLASAIRSALKESILTLDDWTLDDDQLVSRLLKSKTAKRKLVQDYFGQLPEAVFCYQYKGRIQDYGFSSVGSLQAFLAEVFEKLELGSSAYTYAFVDQGTFSKSLTFVDPGSSRTWNSGSKSESFVVYGFIGRRSQISGRLGKVVREMVVERLGPECREYRDDKIDGGDRFGYSQACLPFPLERA